MKFHSWTALVGATALITSAAVAAPKPHTTKLQNVERLPKPLVVQKKDVAKTRPAMTMRAKNRETMQIVVRLKTPSIAARAANNEKFDTRGAMNALRAEQKAFTKHCTSMSNAVRVLGAVQLVSNSVFLELPPNLVEEIASDPRVERVAPVGNYDLDLSETVPYIGSTVVQAAGFDGSGVRVAVLDSGVDYLHANLGGSGDPADYAANDPNVIETASFPTAKVVGGFDFVGGTWPDGPLAPDPDPLDGDGHGTHVADIIGGQNGVAPGASIYAVQVCSSVSPSCSGVALIQGMEFAVDPNGDGDPSDHVDIVNMSLGSSWGQPFDDDLVLAVNNASAFGVFTVASAGNSAENPYATGTPAAAATALSVAQTQVPSAELNFMTIDQPAAAAGDYLAVFQPWSAPQTSVISGPVTYGDGAGGNLDGCAPFAPGSLSGIVMVDRGACAFSIKIDNIQNGGGALGIIGLITPDEPFGGAFGGGGPFTIAGYMIRQADADIIRAGGAVATFDPANVLPLVGSMVSSSSRGPRNGDNLLKPEIGAPGASVSAEVGTGTGMTPFGGTSGAAPMVSGAAALLAEVHGVLLDNVEPHKKSLIVKALLMNNAERNINRDATGALAEVSRIGAGEVRVDDAFAADILVWSVDDQVPSLSLGFFDADKNVTTITKRVVVYNMSPLPRRFDLSSTFRFANDEALGALDIRHPARVRLAAYGSREFNVRFRIRGDLLNPNGMSSGASGNDPSALTLNELDGYLVLDDGNGDQAALPWHVLPRRAADVRPNKDELQFGGNGEARIRLRNRGTGDAQNEAFDLIAVSPNLPEGPEGGQAPTPDLRAVGVNTTPVPAGFCSSTDSFLWRFAFNTHERQTHLLPVGFSVLVDTDQDGTDDFEIFNLDLAFVQTGGLGGQEVTWVENLATGDLSAFFFAEHATNTANTVLTICAEQIGLSGAALGTTSVDVELSTFDFYFGGPADAVTGGTLVPGGERYAVDVPAVIAPNGNERMTVTQTAGTSNALGVLLFTNSDFGAGATGGATQASEALIFRP